MNDDREAAFIARLRERAEEGHADLADPTSCVVYYDEMTALLDLAEAAWVLRVPKRELTTLHHALRLAAKHPTMSAEERAELEQLADVCWNEHASRVAARLEANGVL